MSTQLRGLGRGLGALIPQADTTLQTQDGTGTPVGLLAVPVGDIIPNPRQLRAAIHQDTLKELAASIREHGLLQPLIITRARPTDPVPYQLIAGERRWRAAQMAGLKTVPALLKEATPQQFLEIALVENIQRADLNPLEEAGAYQTLMAEFGLTQAEVAARVGRSRTAVANIVRLLRLPEPVKALLAQGKLSEGHARALLGLPDDALLAQAAQQVVARDLTVRQTEELVRRLLATTDEPLDELNPELQDIPYALETRRLEAAFRDALGTKISLTRGHRGGKLVIHFYSDEELQAIYKQIVGGE